MSGRKPAVAAVPVVRWLLREQLRRASACEKLLRTSGPVEAVHDFRVAQRRTRVMLREYRDQLPGRAPSLRDDLRWLADRTGPVRDLDMLIAGLAGRGAAHGSIREAVAVLEDERRLALGRLLLRLDSERYRVTMNDWRDLAGRAGRRPAPVAVTAFAGLTGVRLRDRYVRLAGRIERLGDTPDDASLHRTRIAAKSVRYLLEFLHSVAPTAHTAAAIRTLKGVQDRLGAFQDDAVHVHLLGDRIASGAFPDPAPAKREAERLARRRDRARPVLVRSLGRVVTPGFRARIDRIAGPETAL